MLVGLILLSSLFTAGPETNFSVVAQLVESSSLKGFQPVTLLKMKHDLRGSCEYEFLPCSGRYSCHLLTGASYITCTFICRRKIKGRYTQLRVNIQVQEFSDHWCGTFVLAMLTKCFTGLRPEEPSTPHLSSFVLKWSSWAYKY